ncbi:MAG TPA: immunoglobulin domain-containing protein, partial [Verrucomicrobiae bacterium]|nr:immunoglobulin domain-containing protein [Verrucomicrobiae bacterium]
PSMLSGDQTHPQSQLVRAGETVTFHAGVEGEPPITYQWRFMGNVLPDETNQTLTFTAELADAGEYTVLITEGPQGSTRASNPATLVVVSPPQIVSQPEDYIRGAGMSVEFAVAVEGTSPFTYHWRKVGQGVPAEPVGISAPVLSLPSVSFADRGGYDVIIENNFGSATSRVATLQVYALPAIAAVPDLFAEVLRPLFVTNVVTDQNVPPLNLRYALAPNAPTNAYLHPLTGVFRWTPNRSQAPGTHSITVSVSDQTYPILSDSVTFNVHVNDYLELSIGSLIMLAETNGIVPISLFSSLPLTELRAVLGFSGQYFSDISLEQPGVQIANAAFQRLDANSAALTFTAGAGGNLEGSNQLAVLRMAARPLTDSAAVLLRIDSLNATPVSGDITPTMLANDGQVVIVGTRPLLEAHLTPQGARELTLYARPGLYQLQWATNLVNPVTWRLRGNATINSNLFLLIRPANTPPTNMPGFFRVRQ